MAVLWIANKICSLISNSMPSRYFRKVDDPQDLLLAVMSRGTWDFCILHVDFLLALYWLQIPARIIDKLQFWPTAIILGIIVLKADYHVRNEDYYKFKFLCD